MTLVEEYSHLVYKSWMDFTKSQLTRIKGPFYIQIFEMKMTMVVEYQYLE